MPKKIVSMVLALVMLLLSSGAVFSAESFEIAPRGKTIIEAEDYTDNYDPKTGDVSVQGSGTNKYISFNPGEWVEYSLSIPKDGEYNVVLSLGIAAQSSKVKFTISLDGEEMEKREFEPTSGYTDYQPRQIERLNLKKGIHILKIENTNGGCHFNSMTVSYFDPNEDTSNFAKTSGSYRSTVIPSLIEAEDFDLGAEGRVSVDGFNSFGGYRPDDGIDIKKNADGSHFVTLNKGESTKYTFNVKIAGCYTMSVLSQAEGNVNVYFDGMPSPVAASLLAEETKITTVYLDEGEHFICVASESASIVFDSIRFISDDEASEYITLDSLVVTPEVEEKKESFEVEFNDVYKELYVSTNGSDENDGSKDAPFKTIKAAKENAAELSVDMTGDIIINIEPGMYQLTETEVFGVEHGGKNGFNIVYRGTNKDDQPIISGGEEITGWQKVDDKLWQAKAEGFSEMRNLYVDDFPAIRARSKYLYVHRGVYNDPDTESEYDGLYVDSYNFPENIKYPEDVELLWSLDWTSQIIPVDKIIRDENSDKVAIKCYNPAFEIGTFFAGGTTKICLGEDKQFFMENDIAFLDEPGEFYFDKHEKMVYYYPYECEDMTKAKTYASKVEHLIKINGNSIDEKVENITFDNIKFRHGAWNVPSTEGMVSVQADQTRYTGEGATLDNKVQYIPQGQVAVNKASNINVVNCDFACLGSTAITMTEGVRNSKVVGNLFRDLSGGAVSVGTYEHGKAEELLKEADMQICKDVIIANNVIRRVAGEYRTLVPISTYYEKNISILNNDIETVPYTGITAGWGWGADPPIDWGNIKINNNRIAHVMISLIDGGQIYTLGPMRGSEISGNYLSDSHYTIAGVYNDSGSAYISITDNVIDTIDGRNWWYQGLYHTKEIVAKGNFSSSKTMRESGTNTLEDQTYVLDKNWPDEALAIMAAAGVEPEYKHLLDKAKMPEGKYTTINRIPKKQFVSEKDLAWIQAEDFKKGGQGIGYNKIQNYYGGVYRPFEAVGIMVDPYTRNGYVIDRNFGGEWFAYDIEVEKDGEYYIDLKAGHGYAVTERPWANFYIDNKLVVENYQVPGSGWSTIVESQVGKVYLTKGSHTLKLEVVDDGFYIDAIRVHDGSEYETEDGVRKNDQSYDEGAYVDEADYYYIYYGEPEIENFEDCIGHWAEDDIYSMKIAGYANGVSETMFAPDSQITKKQAILFVLRTFSLINDDSLWLDIALKAGLTDGTGNFDEIITREEFAEIIIKLKKYIQGTYKLVVGSKPYNDMADISSDKLDYVLSAYEHTLMTGDENGNFRPKSGLSRAEALVVIKRMMS